MAKKRVLEYANGRLKGTLTDNVCNILETLRGVECVSDLFHIIYNLDDSCVTDIIKSMETYGTMPLGIEKPLGTLTPLQTVGVSYMFWAERLILGDSVGMGKTVESAGLIRYLDMQYQKKLGRNCRYLFLTGKNLADEARHALIKFTGEYNELLFGESAKVRKFIDNHLSGTDYSLVGVHSLLKNNLFIEWLMTCREFPFDVLFIDEGSVLGSPTSEITKSAKEFVKNFKRVYILNATPFEDQLGTFISQLQLLDNKLLPTKEVIQSEYFVMKYNGAYKVPSGKYRNGQRFKDLVGYRYLARTRKANGGKIENCTAELVMSPLSKAQKRLMSSVSLWRMVCDCPSYFNQSFSNENVDFTEENVPKLQSLRLLLSTNLSEVDSIIIYCPYLETQYRLSEWLSEMGYSNMLLNGNISKQDNRIEIIRRFKNKEFRILITNVQKGLNFGDCDHCVFYSFDPNPQKMVQMEGRITREFDIINKHIYLLCSEGKEFNFIENKLKVKALNSSQFTELDMSCIMSLLLD